MNIMRENLISMLVKSTSRLGSREALRYKKGGDNSYDSISWEILLSNCKKVTRALISLGLDYGDNIGIFSDNRPDWLIADLGIIANRSVVVPLYATSSRQQLKYITDETRMKLIFVGNSGQYEKAVWIHQNSNTLKKIVVFDQGIAPNNDYCIDWLEFIKLGSGNDMDSELNNRINSIKSDDLVTIIYTSGTTGDSKGAMLTHDRFLSAFRIHDKRLDFDENDVSVCFLPLSHVFERTWTFYLLHKGATNVFIDNPREVIKQLPVIKPTLMCTVPRFFEKTYEGIQLEKSKWSNIKKKIFDWSIKTGHKYSEYLSNSDKPPVGLSITHAIADKLVLKKLRSIFGGRIKFMPCAGAAISPGILKFFHAAGVFVNYGYGATETTATVSCFKSDRYNFDTCGSIMPDVEIKISDKGEILIKGDTVFAGYYNKPEETRKILIDGWYYSGDQGTVTENGELIMTDRIKDLIKTSVGKYVSPQKIEMQLGQDPFIEQVIAIGDARKFVTALIVPSFETLRREVENMGLHLLDNDALVTKNEIIEFFKERINRLQEEFTPYERVVKFKLLPEPFTIQNGMLTNTLKVRRNILIELYKEDIDKMYLP
jgi:long-chain acyl-CoA synthetase